MKGLFILILIVLAVIGGWWLFRRLAGDTTLPEPGPPLPKPGAESPPEIQEADDRVQIGNAMLEKRDSDKDQPDR